VPGNLAKRLQQDTRFALKRMARVGRILTFRSVAPWNFLRASLMNTHQGPATPAANWNKGRRSGEKFTLKRNKIWAIRLRVQPGYRTTDLSLFNLAIDSKLRGCELVRQQVGGIAAVRPLGDTEATAQMTA
jgi:hypothetical protein